MELSTDEITAISREKLRMGPFPYRDCRLLQSRLKRKDDLTPELSSYFSSVAGMASGVHWQGWTLKMLHRALWYLKRDAVESCPSLGRYMHLISHESTPRLYRELETTDIVRRALIPHVEALVRPKLLAARISRRKRRFRVASTRKYPGIEARSRGRTLLFR